GWEVRLREFEHSRWQRLNYLSYVDAMTDVSRFEEVRNQIGIAVENPLEQKIFENTAKMRAAVGLDIRAGAVYVHEQIMPPHDPANSKATRGIYYLPDEINSDYRGIVRGIYGLAD